MCRASLDAVLGVPKHTETQSSSRLQTCGFLDGRRLKSRVFNGTLDCNRTTGFGRLFDLVAIHKEVETVLFQDKSKMISEANKTTAMTLKVSPWSPYVTILSSELQGLTLGRAMPCTSLLPEWHPSLRDSSVRWRMLQLWSSVVRCSVLSISHHVTR